MKWLSRLFCGRRLELQLDKELRFHFDQMMADLTEQGVPSAEAQRRAALEFGGMAQLKEDCRDARGTRLVQDLASDVRYALRSLRQHPGFASVAVLSLALGLGANTAVFSMVDAVLLKNLPVGNPEQLRIVTWVRDQWQPANHSGYSLLDENGRHVDSSFAYTTYLAFRDHVPQFSDVVGFAQGQFTVTAAGTSDAARGYYVSGNYFSGLEASPMRGRAISPQDDGLGKPGVVVLTYQYWQRRFGTDPSVIGRAIRINNRPATVIGVMPRAFQGTMPGPAVDVMVPMSMIGESEVADYSFTDNNSWWVQVFARVKPGVTDAAATAATRAVMARQIETYHALQGVPQIVLEPGSRGVGLLRGSLRESLMVLTWTMAIVLLIACVNMANLLLARSAARTREVAIRVSIGASRGRLIRQMLTESLLLSGMGAVVGLAVAEPMRRMLMHLGARTSALGLDSRLDWRALSFMLAASLGTGLLFGILPALRWSRTGVTARLKEGGAAAAGRTSRQFAGRLLVSAQIALSLLLLTGAGLFVRTLWQLGAVDLGFRAENLLQFQTDPSRSGYKDSGIDQVGRKLQDKLSAIPGVESVGMSQQELIAGSVSSGPVLFEGSKQGHDTLFLFCSESFLRTMSIPIVLGWGITASDIDGQTRSAIVNEAFVKQYLPGVMALGRTFTQEGREGKPFTIVGVAKDAHYERVRGEAQPTAYLPYGSRYTGISWMAFVIRTPLPAASMAVAVRRAVASVDETLPVAEMRTEREQIDRSLGTERLFAGLVSLFAAMAAVLAAIGLYGVMAYSVARRTAEIGIRVALGAKSRDVQWLIVRQSLVMVVVGIALGIPAAFALTRLLRSMLYEVSPGDPLSFAVAICGMAFVAAVAAWGPATRASRVDPLVALRHQ